MTQFSFLKRAFVTCKIWGCRLVGEAFAEVMLSGLGSQNSLRSSQIVPTESDHSHHKLRFHTLSLIMVVKAI